MTDIEYLKSLQAVRERSRLVLGAAEKDELTHFTYDASLMPKAAEFVAGIINRDFGPDRFDQIPPHGRWQHFDVGGVARIDQLVHEWKLQGLNKQETTRRLIDLFFVAVLLDAGAGDTWSFTEPGTGNVYGRSEGIAVAALYMFKAGAFSSNQNQAESVDGNALAGLEFDSFQHYFQLQPKNMIVGEASRVKLLKAVGSSLLALPNIFGPNGRPGNLVDYLSKDRDHSEPLDFEILWTVLQETLLPAWPKDRTHIAGVPIGDAWPLEVLARINVGKQSQNNTLGIQPFHKLTQWMAYSLTVPFMRILQREWKNLDLGTGLPEYRNGGLFVDLGILKLKEQTLQQGLDMSKQGLPSFNATGDVIVEWRAMTVALLDELHKLLGDQFSGQGVSLTMPQMLEAGTWKGGRELAAKIRPLTKSSPILIEGDGTLF
ncbi:hypothetical protein N7523_000779 [Penicillium sp. IBT 18751x]|nr:hypothetical protein N7523_000779 [Penicillium sp. IBT 18751x]